MSGGRRRGKGGHGGEFHVDERWMTSYADMITVLMCLFIVLYAMSTVDSHKFDVLKNSLASGFGVTKTDKIDQSDSIVPKKYVKKNGQGFSPTTLSSKQPATTVDKYLVTHLQQALTKAGESSKVEVRLSAQGVTIGLVGSSTYFGGNDATLQPEGMRILSIIGPTLKGLDRTITIEGHADPHGSAGAYGNDWALAAARSTTVLTWLTGHSDVAPTKITAVSYGSAYPITTEAAEEERNRRVDIVVHDPSTTASTSTSSSTDAAAEASDATQVTVSK